MNRRAFLQAAATIGAVTLAGCPQGEDSTPELTPSRMPPETNVSSTPTRTPTPEPPLTTESIPTDESTRTEEPVTTETRTPEGDGLTDITVDASENDEISDLVNGIKSGQRLIFPSGRFKWTEEVRITADNWGIRCQDDTVFEVPAGMGDGNDRRVLVTHDKDRTADQVQLENLTFDSSGRSAPSILLSVRNTGHINGLEYQMNGPLSNQPQQNGLRAYVENNDGWLQIDNYRQFNNGDLGAYAKGDSRIGVYVPPTSHGTIVIQNPVLQGFPNNACYVSRQPGTVVIAGGLMINNNVSAVRVSGNVLVRNTTIYIDTDRYLDGPGRIDAPDHNTRGLWGDNRKEGANGGLITGVSCILKSYQRCTGIATILENPWMSVQNSQFLLDTDVECIRAEDGQISVVDCNFAGGSAGTTAGVGEITGTGGQIASNIDPGVVPVQGRKSEFNWNLTHLETPNRSDSVSD